MLPLDETSNGPKLTYQGNAAAKDFHGRMFVQVPGYAKNLFVYGGLFETDADFRGFDCITYVGTACGGSNMHMAAQEDLANSLAASRVSITQTVKDKKTGQPVKDKKTGKDTTVTIQLENTDPANVKEFFAGPSTGYFLLWMESHIVLVVNGDVHEFKASAPSGYNCTPVAKWLEPYKKGKLTVRQLAIRPARAY